MDKENLKKANKLNDKIETYESAVFSIQHIKSIKVECTCVNPLVPTEVYPEIKNIIYKYYADKLMAFRKEFKEL